MARRTLLLVILALIGISTLVHCRQTPRTQTVADLVVQGGSIYTMNSDSPTAESVVIGGERILFVGKRSRAASYIGPETRVVELGDRAAYPGFNDAHAHLVGLGASLRRLDLMGTPSFESIVEMVAAAARESEPGQWILGRGWDQNDWPEKAFPTHQALSAVSPENPVVLERVDGHAVMANRRAMDIAGIDTQTPDPDGGKIHRDARGRATGVLIDTASGLVERHVPESTREEIRKETLLAIEECYRYGLVGIHDAGVDKRTLEVYRELIDDGRFDFRLYAMVSATSPYLQEALRRGPEIGTGNHRLTVRAVKMYVDGALGSRGAALLEPYSDDPTNRGLLVTDRTTLETIVNDCLGAGFQVCTHAIGDRGNRLMLDTYQTAFDRSPYPDPRFRIEHAQVLALEDIPRFRTLGIIPSMQPTHCTSDMDWAPDRLGDSRTVGAYAWRSLLDDGNPIPCGSDFPVERVNPLLGVYAAVTRQHPDGTPDGGWFPDQRMTREEVVRGFTADAAYAAFEEDLRGTLEVGKFADLSIFDRDILECPDPEILEARAWMTIVAGNVVYGPDAR